MRASIELCVRSLPVMVSIAAAAVAVGDPEREVRAPARDPLVTQRWSGAGDLRAEPVLEPVPVEPVVVRVAPVPHDGRSVPVGFSNTRQGGSGISQVELVDYSHPVPAGPRSQQSDEADHEYR